MNKIIPFILFLCAFNVSGQGLNYKHEGYTITHFSKDTLNKKQFQNLSITHPENYKTNNFIKNKTNFNLKKDSKDERNCFESKDNYKSQFHFSEKNIQNISIDSVAYILIKKE